MFASFLCTKLRHSECDVESIRVECSVVQSSSVLQCPAVSVGALAVSISD